MAIVNHQNLEPEEAEITKYAFAEKELVKHLGWEGVWDRAIEHWQFQSWPFTDAPGEVSYLWQTGNRPLHLLGLREIFWRTSGMLLLCSRRIVTRCAGIQNWQRGGFRMAPKT